MYGIIQSLTDSTISYGSVHTPTNMPLLSVNILDSRQYYALKFIIYIHLTIGDNSIPNLMFCDMFNFILYLTPLLDLDCDSTICYCRYTVSYHRHVMPSSLATTRPSSRQFTSVVSRRILRGLLYNQPQRSIHVYSFCARCDMPSCFFVANFREIRGPKEAYLGKNFSKRAAGSVPS